MVHALHAHIVLLTKYRRDPITDRVRELLIEITREVCERHGVTLVEADGETDYLHLLIDYPPRVSISMLVGAIKTNTSKQVRVQGWSEVTDALRGQHFWSPSYLAVSTGGEPLELVADYVRNQHNPSKNAGRPKTNH